MLSGLGPSIEKGSPFWKRDMKQEIPTTESKASTLQHSPVSVARARVSRTKNNGVSVSPSSKARPKPSPAESNNSSRVRRSIITNKPKEKEMEDPKIVDQTRAPAVEQYGRVRRHVDTNRKGSEYQNDGKARDDDLQRRVNVSESLVKELKSEVSALEAQLEKMQSRNVFLESQNKQLGRDLSSAEAKIKALEERNQVEVIGKDIQPSDFKDVRELIANKLDLLPGKREVPKENKPDRVQPLAPNLKVKCVEIHPKVQLTVPPPPAFSGPPPPPPPPPPRVIPSRANTTQRAMALVEFYHSITKTEGKKGNLGNENCSSPVASKAHNSIVDELQNRSAHLLAIKADIEKKGEFINQLIQKIQSADFTNIEDVLVFVDWIDKQLSTLADERAVLKHFNWPERKADALREAAFEYRDLNRLLAEVSFLEDDVSLSCDAILKKITTLLDKSERSIQRLIRLRDTNMLSYKDFRIPIEWMFDSGMISKIKLASGKLAKIYIKRVSTGLELAIHTESESKQEALLLQGVRFAYRAYQFGGGLDSETMRAFEELRERVQLTRRGSGELLQGVSLP